MLPGGDYEKIELEEGARQVMKEFDDLKIAFRITSIYANN
jgi:hypothetical protein